MKKKIVKYIGAFVLGIPSYSVATQGVESSAPSVKDSADVTAANNLSGEQQSNDNSDMLSDAGKALMASGDFVGGMILMMMAKKSSDQAAAHAATNTESLTTSTQTDGYNNSTPSPASDPTDPDPEKTGNKRSPDFNKTASSIRPIKTILKKLEKAGIYDSKKDTVNIDGKTYKGDDFSSAGAMAAAGIPKSNIDSAMAIAAAVEKKVAEKYKMGSLTRASGFGDGGGGGGRGSSGDSSSDFGTSPYGSANSSAFGKNERDPSSLAGMQKNYNGEPIGVAADSIFAMMNRRYKVKESQDSFYIDSDPGMHK